MGFDTQIGDRFIYLFSITCRQLPRNSTMITIWSQHSFNSTDKCGLPSWIWRWMRVIPLKLMMDVYVYPRKFSGTPQILQKHRIPWARRSQHHIQPFKLIDPAKPEFRNILVAYLVDPNLKVISTLPNNGTSWPRRYIRQLFWTNFRKSWGLKSSLGLIFRLV
jgi:hypothetical protein